MYTPSTGTSLPSGDSEIQGLSSCDFNIFGMWLPTWLCLFASNRQKGREPGKLCLGNFSKLRLNILQVTDSHIHCLSLNRIAT